MLGIASSASCAGAELVGRASFLSLSTIQTAVLGVILAQAGESQRRENSIFPSASVGTPLQVAGRYRQARTVCSTLRSPAEPALCRIRGLRTRPSAPMMKLTLTFSPASLGTIRGLGVVKACGGWVSSQRGRAL